MDNLQQYIQEKLKISETSFMLEKLKINSKTKIIKYNYYPKDVYELRDLLEKLINERGENADLNDIDTSKVKYMHNLFHGLDPHNINISQWDVSNVEDMRGMFWNCRNFNCNLNNWNVKKDVIMNNMFLGTPLEKNPPKWYKIYF